MPFKGHAYYLQNAGEPLVKQAHQVEDPAAGEAVVEVLACGLCHTDLGYANGSVKTNHALPLVLGHEVVGKVVAASPGWESLLEQPVVVPAVMPCGECAFCSAGRGNACLRQKMPGNDIHGGLSTHMTVPAASLVSLAGAPEGTDLRQFSVVADAVSTAYQAVLRSGLSAGDVAFVVGAGGVGIFTVQIAKALGARVIALDLSADRLAMASKWGADHVINPDGKTPRDVRKEAHGAAREWGIPSLAFRIFECAGAPQSQIQAFTLIQRGATMVQVGFTPKKVEVRLSNLMAFDATIHGSWGCPPEMYGPVLEMVYDGRVKLEPFIEYGAMSDINKYLGMMADHCLSMRMVLDPNQ